VIYLIIITIFLSSNSISSTNAVILLLLYIVHIFAMKWNVIYEVAIKKNVARGQEVIELIGLAKKDISFYHQNLNSRAITIEALVNLDYKVENKYIVFDQRFKKKIKEPKVVFAEEESPMLLMDDRNYVAKLLWKKAAAKIMIRIQAFKFQEKIKRNQKSAVDIVKILPYLLDDPANFSDDDNDAMKYLAGETVLYPRNTEVAKSQGAKLSERKPTDGPIKRT
jgi:hypothetical protein